MTTLFTLTQSAGGGTHLPFNLTVLWQPCLCSICKPPLGAQVEQSGKAWGQRHHVSSDRIFSLGTYSKGLIAKNATKMARSRFLPSLPLFASLASEKPETFCRTSGSPYLIARFISGEINTREIYGLTCAGGSQRLCQQTANCNPAGSDFELTLQSWHKSGCALPGGTIEEVEPLLLASCRGQATGHLAAGTHRCHFMHPECLYHLKNTHKDILARWLKTISKPSVFSLCKDSYLFLSQMSWELLRFLTPFYQLKFKFKEETTNKRKNFQTGVVIWELIWLYTTNL